MSEYTGLIANLNDSGVNRSESSSDSKFKYIANTADIPEHTGQCKLSVNKISSKVEKQIGLPTTGQSPINLDDRLVRKRKYPPLVLNGHWLNDGEARLLNTGTTAKIWLTGNRMPSTICGGPLSDDIYELMDVHFHWGEDNCKGAEHTINDTWYSMESHVVHWNRKYVTVEECFRHKDGFCILAYLFLVQPDCCNCINPQLERITEHLKYIPDPDMETKIPPSKRRIYLWDNIWELIFKNIEERRLRLFVKIVIEGHCHRQCLDILVIFLVDCLAWMRWSTYCTRYYTYAGSYNIGEYPECVTWIVFPVVIPIRASEIKEFRRLRDRDGNDIKTNWREIQLLRCRQIFLAIS